MPVQSRKRKATKPTTDATEEPVDEMEATETESADATATGSVDQVEDEPAQESESPKEPAETVGTLREYIHDEDVFTFSECVEVLGIDSDVLRTSINSRMVTHTIRPDGEYQIPGHQLRSRHWLVSHAAPPSAIKRFEECDITKSQQRAAQMADRRAKLAAEQAAQAQQQRDKQRREHQRLTTEYRTALLESDDVEELSRLASELGLPPTQLDRDLKLIDKIRALRKKALTRSEMDAENRAMHERIKAIEAEAKRLAHDAQTLRLQHNGRLGVAGLAGRELDDIIVAHGWLLNKDWEFQTASDLERIPQPE